ncbi:MULTISPECIES: leucine-rich repeat domain-containing protein [Mediterranea]|uniref:leucine-rich repeat domain-containing protein n=1 Tax=Mediterranea TaxID=1926659 RepID=UPI002011F39D|nr:MULTISPECIES: leucine-rich repeat domain-containing protein [Mediterranea]MCL1606683.1 leucine-rich repeat domain-containing protein [Mediterranea sp. ET5]MDM8122729.1 leucine-rich repeat domain-containing protein [Mediterranea massiliensis]MDM8197185.1 leucine-rich repeat domain-containing protein [Mediterranea massiliensis]
MAKLYDEKITKATDWGGDESTGGLPVSGRRVQEFIKGELGRRAGVFHYDTANNRYLVFADGESRDRYLENPDLKDLLLGAFDAPFNYSAKIELLTPMYNAVQAGSKGNRVEFSFDTQNKQGQSMGENVLCTYTIRRGTYKQTVTEQYAPGKVVSFPLDDYLNEGTNHVTVAIQGVNTLAATSLTLTYRVVNLSISCETDVARVYDLSEGAQTLEAVVNVSGYGIKVVECYLDGELLPASKEDDEVVELSSRRTRYIPLADLQQGTHSLQVRARTNVEGEDFFSDTLYREFMVYTGAGSDTLFAIETTIPAKEGIARERRLYGLTQYVPYRLRFASYTPTPAQSVTMTVALDGTVCSTLVSANGIANEAVILPKADGAHTLRLSDGTVTHEVLCDVQSTSMNIGEISNGLRLSFDATGRTNHDEHPEVYETGGQPATLEGFEWNERSGWDGNALLLAEGNSLSFAERPLGGDVTVKGLTLEMEFASTGVRDDGAVLLDLTDNAGTGLLVTASRVSLTSKAGVRVETPYKDGENNRIAVVVHRRTGESLQGLVMIYVNGVPERAAAYLPGDSFRCEKALRIAGTAAAGMRLRSIRLYDAPLSSDQLLNNYILYRESVEEMTAVYERNDIYEEGTTDFSPERMAGRLPVMVITGDIPLLENTTDKNLQTVVDIEYRNLQDPSRSFTLKRAALRPQGTSSMGYPKKNFRFYTRRRDDTVLLDADGKVVKDRLYAFKRGAQPVDCWCLKADYAESSGTHNTGVARLWNKVMYDAVVDGEYRLRTQAQQAAVKAGYEYDVRTTVDGFPIALFYRMSENDPLIFIGKYNFNNDKSTESVFGFEGIPGFDNSRMQCWEVLNNGNRLALFQDVEDWDTGWDKAFEGRYPDGNKDTADLKAFAAWMVGCKDDAERFRTEKWEHLDVWKVAAYYVYLMRFGAVDQTVKNAMFTTEDGVHWFFINYDNDTVNGLTNDGRLIVPPTATRTTLGADGQPYYAGGESVLWNRLEEDAEFMEVVRKVDNALYTAGLRYDKVIEMFDGLQAGRWVERVYSRDAQYKYIGPYVNEGIDNLFMLQGTRSQHRRYWIARRFAHFDAKYISGGYKANSLEIKCINNTPAGQEFSITAGAEMEYGYGINNVPREGNVALRENETHRFTTTETLNLGDPIRIYAAPYLKGLDLSAMADRISILSLDKVSEETLGTRLERLVVGHPEKTNTVLTALSGLGKATNLEELDVRGLQALHTLDLSKHRRLRKLYAAGSGLSSLTLPEGGSLEVLSLPAGVTRLELTRQPILATLEVEMNGVSYIDVKGCPGLTGDFARWRDWRKNKATEDAACSLTLHGVNWHDVDAQELIDFLSLKRTAATFDVRGRAALRAITQEQVSQLSALLGNDCFELGAVFSLSAPESLFIVGRTELKAGESEQYRVVAFNTKGKMEGEVEFKRNESSSHFDITKDGLATTRKFIGGRFRTSVKVLFKPVGELSITKVFTVYTTGFKGLETAEIDGRALLKSGEENVFTASLAPADYETQLTPKWTLSGEGADTRLQIVDPTPTSCKVKVLDATPGEYSLKLELSQDMGGKTIVSNTFSVTVLGEDIVMTSVSNPKFMFRMHRAGFSASPNKLTQEEADKVIEFPEGVCKVESYEATPVEPIEPLQRFHNLRRIGSDAFSGFRGKGQLIIPDSVEEILSGAFSGMNYVSGEVMLPKRLRILQSNAFQGSSIESIAIPEGITGIPEKSFYYCSKLKKVSLHSGVTGISYRAFSFCGIESIEIPSSVKNISAEAFLGSSLKRITLPSTPISLGMSCFKNTKIESFRVTENITMDTGIVSECLQLKELIIEKNMKTTPSFMCNGCSSLASVILSEGVRTIGKNSFSRCSSLASVILPEGLETIDREAFADCSSLTSVTFPEGLKEIGSYAFQRCSSLTSVTFPRSLTGLGDDVFESSGVVEVTWKSLPPLHLLRPTTFRRCIIDIDNYHYPEITDYIPNYFFSNVRMKNGTFPIPETVTWVGSAFAYAIGLTHLSIPPAALRNTSFVNFSGTDIEEMRVPDGVTSLGRNFADCKKLRKVTLPEGITSLEGTFAGCSVLESITIPESVTYLNATFNECINLRTIICKPKTAPVLERNPGPYGDRYRATYGHIFGFNETTYTGRNTYNTGENRLIVPVESSCYTWGDWGDILLNKEKCGFTLQQTL